MNCQIKYFSQAEKNRAEYNCSEVFKFVGWRKMQSLQKEKIPATVGKKLAFTETDVVDEDIPVPLSKEKMKSI